MKKKAMPPMAMTAGQCGRILFNFTLPEGTAMPELVGALMVHGQRVDMVRESEDRLLIPVCPPGVYLAEVRAAGVCVLYGHVEVLPSPLYEQEGVVCYTIDVDAKTDVLAVSLSMVEGIPGPRGEQGIQGERGLVGASAYDLAVAAGYEGSEAEWVAELQGAQAAANAARASEAAAAESARAAREDKAAAVQARDAALAAQGTAEEHAAIAKLAAEEAQAPESIAAQAARPATMVLLKDELLSLLGDASLFDIDTDGQNVVVHTSRLEGDTLAAVEDMLGRFVPGFLEVTRYNHHIEYTYAEYMKYADVETLAEMRELYPEYMNDVTETGVWAYNLDNMTTVHCHVGGDEVWARLFNKANNIVKLYLSLPKLTFDGTYMVRYCDNLEELEIFYNSIVISVRQNPKLRRAKIIAPKAYLIDYLFEGSPLLEEWEVVADWPNVQRMNNSFRLQKTLTSWSTPLPRCETMQIGNFSSAFTSWEVDLPALKVADTAFSYCTLDKASVLIICNSIPTWSDGETHKLGLGINVDLQSDEEVLAAIAAAEGKGWVLAVTWRGTPSVAAAASTFGLRDPLIYAKVGEYEEVDGKLTRVLEWCHYVTNEEGYETFRSLVSAYEYFGLPAEEGGEE